MESIFVDQIMIQKGLWLKIFLLQFLGNSQGYPW